MTPARSTAIGFLACILIMLVELPVVQAEGPSLAETLQWMDSTYNSHQAEGGSFGHGLQEVYSSGKLFKSRSERFTYNGCQFMLFIKDNPVASLYRELYTSEIDMVNLRDVDPASIKLYLFDSQASGLSCNIDPKYMTCDIAELDFETPDQTPLFKEHFHAVYPKLRGKDHDAYHDGKTFVAEFLLDNVEYAKRFTRAFRYAVKLCGGKPSPF